MDSWPWNMYTPSLKIFDIFISITYTQLWYSISILTCTLKKKKKMQRSWIIRSLWKFTDYLYSSILYNSISIRKLNRISIQPTRRLKQNFVWLMHKIIPFSFFFSLFSKHSRVIKNFTTSYDVILKIVNFNQSIKFDCNKPPSCSRRYK